MKWYLHVFKNYATFSGRAHREEFWMFTLVNMIFIVGLLGFGSMFGTILAVANKSILMAALSWVPYMLYALVMLIPSFAVMVRRLHDTGRSGWWFFISFVPLVGGLILLLFLVSDSQSEENEYGHNPKLAAGSV